MVIRRLDTVITGTRDDKGTAVMVVESTNIQPLYHRVHHSPAGFDWGCEDIGAADLALSILSYCMDLPDTKIETIRLVEALPYQEYKHDVVSKWQRDGFRTTVSAAREWLHSHLDKEDEEVLGNGK